MSRGPERSRVNEVSGVSDREGTIRDRREVMVGGTGTNGGLMGGVFTSQPHPRAHFTRALTTLTQLTRGHLRAPCPPHSRSTRSFHSLITLPLTAHYVRYSLTLTSFGSRSHSTPYRSLRSLLGIEFLPIGSWGHLRTLCPPTSPIPTHPPSTPFPTLGSLTLPQHRKDYRRMDSWK